MISKTDEKDKRIVEAIGRFEFVSIRAAIARMESELALDTELHRYMREGK